MLRASTEDERIVALLHDIVEDTPMTLADLISVGFNERIIAAINCLTRRPAETYEQFIERIQSNDLARRVKILDLEDNSDLSRIAIPSQTDLERVEKYQRALEKLKSIG